MLLGVDYRRRDCDPLLWHHEDPLAYRAARLGAWQGQRESVGGGRARGVVRGGAHTPPGKGGCEAPSCATCGVFVVTVVCHEPKRVGCALAPGSLGQSWGQLASWRVSTPSTLLSTSSPSSTCARDGNGSASREAQSTERQKDCRRGRRSSQRWSSRRRDAISGSRVNPGSSRLSKHGVLAV